MRPSVLFMESDPFSGLSQELELEGIVGVRKRPALLRGGAAAVEIHDQINQSTDSHAGAAFASPGLGIVEPGGAGDIEVHPRGVAGKFTEEPGGDDGAGAAPAAHILNIGDGALDQVVVVPLEPPW